MEKINLFMLDCTILEMVAIEVYSLCFMKLTSFVQLAGDISIESLTVEGGSPQFTLTCISTGGPATTVSWTRDNEPVTEGTESVLVDSTTARYEHRLKTTTGGVYMCSVTNSKPSHDSDSLIVKGSKSI